MNRESLSLLAEAIVKGAGHAVPDIAHALRVSAMTAKIEGNRQVGNDLALLSLALEDEAEKPEHSADRRVTL